MLRKAQVILLLKFLSAKSEILRKTRVLLLSKLLGTRSEILKKAQVLLLKLLSAKSETAGTYN